MRKADLRVTIKDAESHLVDLEREVFRLRQFIAAGKKLLSKNSARTESQEEFKVRRRRKNALADKVRPILEEANRPMHAKDIVERLNADGVQLSPKNPVATVAGALNRRPDEFERVGPNTYALREQKPQ